MALTENEKKPDKKDKPPTKVIIRRLPPTITKDEFINQVSPIPDYNYLYHVKGDMSLGENAFSRAYINFVCPEDVYSFKEKFDNYVFVDNKGHEYTAVVEFAPFQKTPKKRGKSRIDPKSGTIETDTYYLEFVANLNKPVEPNAKPEYSLQLNEKSEDKNKETSTPLLEFIKNKRAQKLVRREEIRDRRKREFEKRKEQKFEGKYYDERSPAKGYGKKVNSIKSPKRDSKSEPFEEKLLEKQNPKEKKPEEKKEKKEIKLRFPKKDVEHSFKLKSHEEPKNTEKPYQKKVKKYSEKREERKMEVQQKKLEQQNKSPLTDKKQTEEKPTTKCSSISPSAETINKKESEEKCDSGASGSSKRIRNKDRPTIPLYRPGMLTKRKQAEPEEHTKTDSKEEVKETNQ
ncbi:hypothetical protein ABEB36_008295 [Hypothenemus hampei]|uniref:UPF3 domain-containing protein n=1 Tax=Hypothenemus hampei TaxID=57062 RepID=A0ABD1ELH4_HYPHA